MTTTAIVFSRDRAMQLDATLRSLLLHCQDASELNLHILYLATTVEHARRYLQLEQDFAANCQIQFVKQGQFRHSVLELLLPKARHAGEKLVVDAAVRLGPFLGSDLGVGRYIDPGDKVVFLVDDAIFVRAFSLAVARRALEQHPDALGFSFRLGRNTTYCYPLDRPQAAPAFSELPANIRKWDWGTGEGDFGYPLELSSSLYRVGQILPMLVRLTFQQPNAMEDCLARAAHTWRHRYPALLCFEQSVAFSNPLNKVQTVLANRAGALPEFSGEELARLFDVGLRIDVQAFDGFVPNACHQEVELIFTKPRGSH